MADVGDIRGEHEEPGAKSRPCAVQTVCPCGNRHPPSDLTFILREIAIGIIRNNQLDIVLHIILRGRWLIQKASQLHMAQVVVRKHMVGVEAGGTRRSC